MERSYETIRHWFHRLENLFEPDCRTRQEVALNETKIEIDSSEHYVWAAVDCETLEVLAVEASPGRSSLDALLFLKDVLEQSHGRPLVRAAVGPWYDWPLELLECEYERETWGNRSLSKPSSASSNTEPDTSTTDFPSVLPPARPDVVDSIAALHNATL